MAAKSLSASGILYTERREFNLNRNDDIAFLYPDANPFLAWMTELEEEEVDDPDFKMFEDYGPWRLQSLLQNGAVVTGYADNGNPGDVVTIDIDNLTNLTGDSSLEGLELEAWDTTKTTYKGVFVVNSVTSATRVVLKVVGNATVANQRNAVLADNDYFEVIGHAWGEGRTAPEASSDELSIAWNSTQITRTAIDITGTLYKTALRGGGSNELERLRRNKMFEHKIKEEKKLLLGYRPGGTRAGASGTAGSSDTFAAAHITDKDGNRARYTMGFIPIMRRYGRTSGTQQNSWTLNQGTAKYSDLIRIMEVMAQYKPAVIRDAFVGPGAMSYFSNLTMAQKSGWNIQLHPLQKDEKLGFMYRILETGHGALRLIPLPIFYGTSYTNFILIPDKQNMKRVFFRPDKFYANIKTDDNYDGIKDEYFSDDGLKLTQSDAQFMIQLT